MKKSNQVENTKKETKVQSQVKSSKVLGKESGKELITKLYEINPYIAFGIFAILTLIFFNAQLGNSFFWEDFTEYVLPHQTYAAKEFAKGYIPFWNNYSFAGMPFLADLQVGFFYPFNRVLNLFLANDRLPVGAIEFVIIIHFLIAQFNFWNLSKSFGANSLSSILGAVTYSFSMLMVCHVIHPMMIYHLAWFPLVLMYFRKAMIGDNFLHNLRYSILSGLIFGFSILSGHPQTMLYISLFLLFVFLFYFVSGFINKLPISKTLSMGIFALIPILVGVGIFAIQLLPSLELAKESRRNENSMKLASEGSLQYSQILSIFNPDIYGKVEPNGKEGTNFYLNYKGDYKTHYYWETAFYFGLGGLILGLFYISYSLVFNFSNKSFEVVLLAFLSLFALLYALGSNGFLFGIFYNLPYFGTFRNPTRIMFFMITAFSLAASLGLDKLFDYKSENSKKVFNSIIIAISVPLLFIILIISGTFNSSFDLPTETPEIASFVSSSATTSMFFILAFGVILYLSYKRVINHLISAAVLSLLVFIDLFTFGGGFNASPSNPLDSYTVDERILSSFTVDLQDKPNELFRVNSRMYNPSYMALPRNIGLMENIMLQEGYNPLVLDKVHPPVSSLEKVNDLHNVKYEIGIDQTQNAPRFYENVNRLGFVWFNENYVKLESKEIEKFLKSNDNFDFTKVAVLEEDVKFISKLEISDTKSYSKNLEMELDSLGNILNKEIKANNLKYNILNYNSEFMEVEITAEKSGLVVFSEVYYPAIVITNNGNPTKLYRANYSLRAVEVKKGKNLIKMTYKSAKYATGSTITIFTLIISMIGLLFTYKEKLLKK